MAWEPHRGQQELLAGRLDRFDDDPGHRQQHEHTGHDQARRQNYLPTAATMLSERIALLWPRCLVPCAGGSPLGPFASPPPKVIAGASSSALNALIMDPSSGQQGHGRGKADQDRDVD